MKRNLIFLSLFLYGLLASLILARQGPVGQARWTPPRVPAESRLSLDYLKIQKEVLPEAGFTLNVSFEDLGPRLLAVGAVSLKKFEEKFQSEGGLSADQKEILTQKTTRPISINSRNSTFMVDFFWALGLTNKNPILESGPMVRDKSQLMNLASTGGWTLGRKKAPALLGKYEVIKLDPSQQKLVEEISASVHRPCCNNPTNFPDCNHGMAALGLIEYLASKNFSSDEIYKALLYFNSFWFPQNYLDLAAHFKTLGWAWTLTRPQVMLGRDYSSAAGYARMKQELDWKLGSRQPPSAPGRGCGV